MPLSDTGRGEGAMAEIAARFAAPAGMVKTFSCRAGAQASWRTGVTTAGASPYD